MGGALIPYLGFAALLLGFVAYDRWRRRNQFGRPPANYSASNGSDWTPSAGFWSSDSGSSWSGADSSCSSGGDSGGSCGGGGD
jgi:hypothetical protein